MDPDEAAARRLIESQRRYYDVRAPDYADAGLPSDRKHPGLLPAGEARRLVASFGLQGDVLELACGTGGLTRELVRHARTLTAVDGSGPDARPPGPAAGARLGRRGPLGGADLPVRNGPPRLGSTAARTLSRG